MFIDKNDLPIKVGDTLTWYSLTDMVTAQVLRTEKRGFDDVLIVKLKDVEVSLTRHETRKTRLVL